MQLNCKFTKNELTITKTIYKLEMMVNPGGFCLLKIMLEDKAGKTKPKVQAEPKKIPFLFEVLHLIIFYRAMLCIRGTSHGPVSVCLSVTSRSSTKTAKRRITQTTPHNSTGTPVF